MMNVYCYMYQSKENLKSSRLSYTLAVRLPLMSFFLNNKISKFETEDYHSVVSSILSLLGYIEST